MKFGFDTEAWIKSQGQRCKAAQKAWNNW